MSIKIKVDHEALKAEFRSAAVHGEGVVLIAVPLSKKPTAQALREELAATPLRTFPMEEGFALCTRCHAVPFQCRRLQPFGLSARPAL